MKKILAILFCISLIGCSGNQIVRTEYVLPQIPEIPEDPSYYSVIFEKQNNNYCLSPDNAKNLLKNIELMKGYQLELKTILEGLKNDNPGNRASNN